MITLGADISENVQSERLFSRINKPVASPRYLERKGGLSSDRDIADADLLHDEKIAHWQQWLRHAGIFKPDAPKGPIFQDFNLLATAAIAGHGVALCPVEVCRREIENGDLIVLSSVSVLEDESYFMISKALRSASATAFCDWFLKLVRSEIATVAC